MKTHLSMQAVLGAALAFSALTACNGSGDEGSDSDASTANVTETPDPTMDPPDPTMDPPDPTMDPPDPTMDPPDPTMDPPDPTMDPPDPTTEGPDTDTGDPDPFVFADDPVDAYTQIDRHGAVEAGTAGIAASAGLGLQPGQDITIRDAYNASNPVEDVAGMWVPEILKSVTFFHEALDDDIEGAGLVPATVDETVMQAGPVIIPDTIKYDPTMPTAYPNGRKLEDPVVDITLAAVLLKLGPQQPLSILADLPLNPPQNDVPFSAEWPYLAPPHKP